MRCKPTTAAQYRAAIDNYILPALGSLPVSSVGRTHVAELQHGCCDRPAMANLVVATLSRMIDQAMAWGLIPDGSNPCRFTRKYRERRRERFLTDAEFRRLGRALDALEAEGRVSVHAGAALRLLILTGCRRNEILTLRWEDVHLAANELRLRDSKTGPRAVSLSPAAVAVLAALPRVAGNPHVIPGARPGARLSGIFEPWRRVRTRAGLDDVRIHDLRHSYASRALALGESLPVIAKLLGHSRIQTTARYAPPDARLGAGGGGQGRRLHRRGHPPAPDTPPVPRAGRTGCRQGRTRLATRAGRRQGIGSQDCRRYRRGHPPAEAARSCRCGVRAGPGTGRENAPRAMTAHRIVRPRWAAPSRHGGIFIKRERRCRCCGESGRRAAVTARVAGPWPGSPRGRWPVRRAAWSDGKGAARLSLRPAGVPRAGFPADTIFRRLHSLRACGVLALWRA